MKIYLNRLGNKGLLLNAELIDTKRLLSVDFVREDGQKFSISWNKDDESLLVRGVSDAITVHPHADNSVSIVPRPR